MSSISNHIHQISVEVDKLNVREELVQTGFFVGGLIVILMTLILSGSLYPQIGLWSLSPAVAGVASIFILKLLSMLRKKEFSPEGQVRILESFRSGLKKAMQLGKLQDFVKATERTLGDTQEIAPIALYIQSLKRSNPQAAAAILVAIEDKIKQQKSPGQLA